MYCELGLKPSNLDQDMAPWRNVEEARYEVGFD